MITVVGGPASIMLAKSIANKIGAKLVKSDARLFPDGESKLTIRGTVSEKTIIVQSTPPPVDSNFVRLLSLVSKVGASASRVIAVVPYLCYMRQDMEFLPGEIVTSKLVATVLKEAGASAVVTVDIHSTLAMDYFGIPIINTSAVPKMASYFKRKHLANPLVVSPDLFWSDKAAAFAQTLGADWIALNKQRDRKTGRLKILRKKKLDLCGRDVILLDDMISTGDSMVKAARYVQSQGCARIFAACTHAILVGDAQRKMADAGITQIVSTNTVSHKTNRIDVSGIIAQSLKQIILHSV